jgi:hypothetical protein
MMMMMMMMMMAIMMIMTANMLVLIMMYLYEFNGIHTLTTVSCDICESESPYILISFPLQSRRVAYKLETLFKWATK